jgi:hypothetical protein
VAVFIFLRLLTGSANHLWLEYAKYDRGDYRGRDLLFTLDVASLTLFGCFGVAICYSQTADRFFYWTYWFLILAFGWSIYDLVRNMMSRARQRKSEIGTWALMWMGLNVVQLAAVIWVREGWGAQHFIQPWLWLQQWCVQPWLWLQPPWCVVCRSVGAVDGALCYRLVGLAMVSAVILGVDFYWQLRQLTKRPRD